MYEIMATNEKFKLNLKYETIINKDKSVIGLKIMWNYKNHIIRDIIIQELIYNQDEDPIYNYMWIDKVKEITNWKRGEEIFIGIERDDGYIKRKCRRFDYVLCWISKIESDVENHIIVDPYGYVNVRRDRGMGEVDNYFIPRCIYNSINENEGGGEKIPYEGWDDDEQMYMKVGDLAWDNDAQMYMKVGNLVWDDNAERYVNEYILTNENLVWDKDAEKYININQ